MAKADIPKAERFQKSFSDFDIFARSSKLPVSVTLASDTWGQAEHVFCIILHFILLTEKREKLSTSQPCVAFADGVQANMVLPSQFCSIFAAFSMGVCPTTERQNASPAMTSL